MRLIRLMFSHATIMISSCIKKWVVTPGEREREREKWKGRCDFEKRLR
jgi:hypothetical protein